MNENKSISIFDHKKYDLKWNRSQKMLMTHWFDVCLVIRLNECFAKNNHMCNASHLVTINNRSFITDCIFFKSFFLSNMWYVLYFRLMSRAKTSLGSLKNINHKNRSTFELVLMKTSVKCNANRSNSPTGPKDFHINMKNDTKNRSHKLKKGDNKYY